MYFQVIACLTQQHSFIGFSPNNCSKGLSFVQCLINIFILDGKYIQWLCSRLVHVSAQ